MSRVRGPAGSQAVSSDLTELLKRWSRGEPDALADLVPIIYSDLRRVAGRALRRERPHHTLQPTALVHEAFVRLAPQQGKGWQNREHFFAVSAGVMRQVLVDYARRRHARKRGSGEVLIALEEAGEAASAVQPRHIDLLDIDRALAELAHVDAKLAELVEMRYFAGMTLEEIARLRGRPEWDLKKDWLLAKAWLARRLDAPH